jgi:hypothetical protein
MGRSIRARGAQGLVVVFALAVVMTASSNALARVEAGNSGGSLCCLELGLRMTLAVEDGHLRSALELSGHELAHITLGPMEAVRWGVPVIAIVTEFQNARTGGLATSPHNISVR